MSWRTERSMRVFQMLRIIPFQALVVKHQGRRSAVPERLTRACPCDYAWWQSKKPNCRKAAGCVALHPSSLRRTTSTHHSSGFAAPWSWTFYGLIMPVLQQQSSRFF